jgi:hypothetical protein
MANQTEPCLKVRKQIVLSAPRKIFVERYLTPKGKRMMTLASSRKEKDAVWAKYGKNRYRINSDAIPVKVIKHWAI